MHPFGSGLSAHAVPVKLLCVPCARALLSVLNAVLHRVAIGLLLIRLLPSRHSSSFQAILKQTPRSTPVRAFRERVR